MYLWISGPSKVEVYSGATGQPLYLIEGESPDFGQAIADAGDVTGDGIGDIVISDPFLPAVNFRGTVYVYDGATGDLYLRAFGPYPNARAGWYVAGVGDLNNDGLDDIAAASGIFAAAYVFTSPNGDLVREHLVPGTAEAPIAGLGDVDGDGSDDYAVGAFGSDLDGEDSGEVNVYNGRDGAVIHRITGPEEDQFLGISLAPTPDMDGDGIQDLWVGIPENTVNGPGRVELRSGASGDLIATHRVWLDEFSQAQQAGHHGSQITAGQDVNGDGIPDAVIGARTERSPYPMDMDFTIGSVSVLSGATFQRIFAEHGSTENGLPLGQRHESTILGDLDGDGYAEWAVLYDNATTDILAPGLGRVYIFRGGPGDALRVCTGAPNSVGSGASIEIPRAISVASNSVRLRATNLPPGEVGQFFYGTSNTGEPPFGDGFLCVGAPFFRIGPTTVSYPHGAAFVNLDLTTPSLSNGPAALLPGTTWRFQHWYRDPSGPGASGVNLSDALEVTFTH